MADVTNSGTFYVAPIGDLKLISWSTTAPHRVTAGDTIDFATDSAGGKINRIHHASYTTMDGTLNVAASGALGLVFSGQTGIVTLPANVSTERINVLVIGT